jgi:hypothetical protein
MASTTATRKPLLGILPAAGLLATATLALGASLAPFPIVRGFLDHSARTGALHEYTPALHASLAGKLRVAGAVIFLAGLLAWRLQARLAPMLAGLARRLRGELREGLSALRPAHSDRGAHLILLAIVVLGAGLRLAFLSQPMRYDEAFTYTEYASRPVYVILSKYDLPNNHVFHSLCVHAACGLFGDAPWAVRLPAFLAGLFVIPATYAAARALYDRPTALLSASLVAGSSILIEYSTNARGYTLITLCFLLLVRLGCALLERPSLLGWGLFALVAALGLWTVPTMLFPYGAVVWWLAFTSLRSGPTRTAYGRSFHAWLAGSCALTAVLTAALYAPVLLVSGVGALTANPFVTPTDPGSWTAHLLEMLRATWSQWHRDVPAPLTVVLAITFLATALGAVRPVSRAVGLAWITVLSSAAVVAVQRVVPYERVWLFAVPLYLIVAAGGLVRLLQLCPTPRLRAFLGPAAAAVVAGLLAWQALDSRAVENSLETGTLREAAEMTAFLKDRLGPQDRIIAWCPSDRALEYYFQRQGVPTRHLVASVGWRKDEPHWHGERLLAVINKAHGQTLAALAQRYHLAEVSEPDAARLLWEGTAAAVYEIPSADGNPQVSALPPP